MPDGGNTPQTMVNRAAKAIYSGKSQAILITGGEAHYTASRTSLTPRNWPKRKKPLYMEGKRWNGINKS